MLVSSTNLKQVKSSACTASRKAARKALTRGVSPSAAWTLFFSPPVQPRHGPPQRGPAHARAAHRRQPDAQLVERRVRLLAHTGPYLCPCGRVQTRGRTAAVGQRRQRTAPALALQQLGHE